SHLGRAGLLVGWQGRRDGSALSDRGLRRQHGARGDEVRRVGARDLNVTVLVDFENDSVSTSLEVARALGPRLWGVRLDTSEALADRSLWPELGDFEPTGVNERLVRKVREALDRDGFERIKIVVSGGFTVEKIREFEERGVPVDSYGVGSSLIRGSNDFTADVVLTDGRPSAKAGRSYRPNARLELVG